MINLPAKLTLMLAVVRLCLCAITERKAGGALLPVAGMTVAEFANSCPCIPQVDHLVGSLLLLNQQEGYRVKVYQKFRQTEGKKHDFQFPLLAIPMPEMFLLDWRL